MSLKRSGIKTGFRPTKLLTNSFSSNNLVKQSKTGFHIIKLLTNAFSLKNSIFNRIHLLTNFGSYFKKVVQSRFDMNLKMADQLFNKKVDKNSKSVFELIKISIVNKFVP